MTWLRGFGRLLVALVVGVAGVGVLAPTAVQAAPLPMVIEVDLSNGAGLQVKLPLDNGNVATAVTVNWGTAACGTQTYTAAGGAQTLASLDISCTYAAGDVANPVQIQVSVTGADTVTWFGGNAATTGAAKFEKIVAWGDLGFVSLNGAFRNMTNLVDVPTTLPGTVTDLSYAFFGATSFNDADIAGWVTTAVTQMVSTFQGATSFNQNIGGWNTANVTAAHFMFAGATAFNQNIGGWNTGNIVNMARMFEGATAFNQDIGLWNTSSVTFMDGMFAGATAFNQAIGNWNTSNVVVMNDMFNGATAFNQPVGNWNVTRVTDTRAMFEGATSFNKRLYNWLPSDLVLASNMFRNATAFNNGCAPGPCADAFSWPNAPDLTQVAGMFANATNFNAKVDIDTDQVTSFAEMFWDATSFNNGCAVGAFTANAAPCLLSFTSPMVTTTSQMFDGATNFNQRLVFSSTANITSIGSMFAGATSFNNGCAANIRVCPFNFGLGGAQQNFGSLTNAGGAFSGATAFNQDLNSWNMSTVTVTSAMFYNQARFNNGCATTTPTCPLTWTTTSLILMDQMFTGVTDFDQPLPNFVTNNVTSMSQAFDDAVDFNQDISGWNVRNVTNMDRMFRFAFHFNQDLSSWCFNGQVSHIDFAALSGFANLTAKHPSWASCGGQIVFVPAVTTPPSTTTTPPTTVVEPVVPSVPPTLPETGRESTLGLVALWLLVMGVIAVRLRLPSRG